MSRQPLRYNISSWQQLPGCLSNNSRELKISVSAMIDEHLSGEVIKVVHTKYGVLFACLVNASGDLLTCTYTNVLPDLTTQQILVELRKYGFIVTFNPQEHLDGDQMDYLMTLNELGFDKIRIMNVYSYKKDGSVEFVPKVVAFTIREETSDLLNNGYSITMVKYLDALNNGRAINISGISSKKKFRWDWLTFVANISDILKDNSRM